MKMLRTDQTTLHFVEEGDPKGPPVVFCNSLATDLRLWDDVMPLLPRGPRYIRFDNRGHGLSSAPPGPYPMGDLVADAANLLDHLDIRDCLFVGLSIGGMIAQGLAAERPDLVRALVLSNTGAKIGHPDLWAERIAQVTREGVAQMVEPTLSRWFSKAFHRDRKAELEGWRAMIARTPKTAYLGCSAAIADTDLYDSTARLRLPCLVIAGSEDGATPPDLLRELAAIIPGSEFHLIRGAGHLPCVEQPQAYSDLLTGFMAKTGII